MYLCVYESDHVFVCLGSESCICVFREQSCI